MIGDTIFKNTILTNPVFVKKKQGKIKTQEKEKGIAFYFNNRERTQKNGVISPHFTITNTHEDTLGRYIEEIIKYDNIDINLPPFPDKTLFSFSKPELFLINNLYSQIQNKDYYMYCKNGYCFLNYEKGLILIKIKANIELQFPFKILSALTPSGTLKYSHKHICAYHKGKFISSYYYLPLSKKNITPKAPKIKKIINNRWNFLDKKANKIKVYNDKYGNILEQAGIIKHFKLSTNNLL